MKKFVFISLISLLVFGSNVSAEVIRQDSFYEPGSLEEFQEEFFEPKLEKPEPKPDNTFFSRGFRAVPDNMGEINSSPSTEFQPVFKKYRIKVSNYFKIKAHEEELREMEELKKELENIENSGLDEDEYRELQERNLKKVFVDENGNEVKQSKFVQVKNFFKKNKKDENVSDLKSDDNKTENIETDETKEQVKSLEGGVNKVVTTKSIVLDCDKLVYNDAISELDATGHPVMMFPQQNVTLKADKLVYNTASNIIKAYDNVELIKNGNSVFGDYLQVDLNDESGLVTNMKTGNKNMVITAKDVEAAEDKIILTDGSAIGEGHYVLRLVTENTGADFDRDILPDDKMFLLSEQGLKVNVKAQDVYITSKKDHDVITFKNADFYHEGTHLYRLPSFTGHTNKEHEYFEGNYPEMGSIPNLGAYIGPGFTFDVPKAGVLKVAPFFNYYSGAGVGAALKYRNGNNYTDAYYGTTQNLIVLRGEQRLDDRLFLQYGINSYLNDWFVGNSMSKYRAELIYKDSVLIPNTIAKGLDATFSQRPSIGYVQASDYQRNHESLQNSGLGTMKFRYMAELNQTLFRYKNIDKQLSAQLSWMLRGSASLYGTGDTQFIGITGPLLKTQYKWWLQDFGYFISGYQDGTPMPRADAYRYGHAFMYIKEGFKLGKYCALSWRGSVATSRDTPNRSLFQENGFFLSVGPDDAKVIVGYDFTRERAYFMVSAAVDMKGTRVDYQKMVIKNPENLNRRKEKVVPVSFDDKPKKREILTNARVINIEDPNKEQPE